MDDVAQSPHHGHRMFALPNVSAQVDADGPVLHPVVDEVHDLTLGVRLRPTGHDYRHRASGYHFIEVLAPVGLNYPGPKLGGYADGNLIAAATPIDVIAEPVGRDGRSKWSRANLVLYRLEWERSAPFDCTAR